MIDHVDATEGSDVVRGKLSTLFKTVFYSFPLNLFTLSPHNFRVEIDEFHTSDSAFDHTSAISRDLQIRLFEVLGMSPYQPPLSDGIQVSVYFFYIVIHCVILNVFVCFFSKNRYLVTM